MVRHLPPFPKLWAVAEGVDKAGKGDMRTSTTGQADTWQEKSTGCGPFPSLQLMEFQEETWIQTFIQSTAVPGNVLLWERVALRACGPQEPPGTLDPKGK